MKTKYYYVPRINKTSGKIEFYYKDGYNIIEWCKGQHHYKSTHGYYLNETKDMEIEDARELFNFYLNYYPIQTDRIEVLSKRLLNPKIKWTKQ